MLVLSTEVRMSLQGVSRGCRGSVWFKALAMLPKYMQEVPAKGSPLFPAQNSISKAYWALGHIRPLSHAAVLSVSGGKQRS